MSASSYRLILLFLLFACIRLCDARRLSSMEKKLDVDHNHLNKKYEDESLKSKAFSKEKADVSNQSPRNDRTDKLDQSDRSNNDKAGVHVRKSTMDDKQRRKRTSIDETTSYKEVSRSWKVVPQKANRRREEHPGFNLDYMQPSIHPPHHN
ncbi:PREDICTED: uncharacterized protein LOC104802465 [Tarenaya hassleriana]|uniref:uncharacterized protein LOC104802465 n=1 Tax=Tarenaya hassleriana TaxID=28532 RepID=UPI00053C8912|nr:PREDICTED: uncharacterized protein LOC104802465 [Tarenaya hassleriana]